MCMQTNSFYPFFQKPNDKYLSNFPHDEMLGVYSKWGTILE